MFFQQIRPKKRRSRHATGQNRLKRGKSKLEKSPKALRNKLKGKELEIIKIGDVPVRKFLINYPDTIFESNRGRTSHVSRRLNTSFHSFQKINTEESINQSFSRKKYKDSKSRIQAILNHNKVKHGEYLSQVRSQSVKIHRQLRSKIKEDRKKSKVVIIKTNNNSSLKYNKLMNKAKKSSLNRLFRRELENYQLERYSRNKFLEVKLNEFSFVTVKHSYDIKPNCREMSASALINKTIYVFGGFSTDTHSDL